MYLSYAVKDKRASCFSFFSSKTCYVQEIVDNDCFAAKTHKLWIKTIIAGNRTSLFVCPKACTLQCHQIPFVQHQCAQSSLYPQLLFSVSTIRNDMCTANDMLERMPVSIFNPITWSMFVYAACVVIVSIYLVLFVGRPIYMYCSQSKRYAAVQHTDNCNYKHTRTNSVTFTTNP